MQSDMKYMYCDNDFEVYEQNTAVIPICFEKYFYASYAKPMSTVICTDSYQKLIPSFRYRRPLLVKCMELAAPNNTNVDLNEKTKMVQPYT